MKNALRKASLLASKLLAFFVSAVLWIVVLFILGAGSIVLGVQMVLGDGPAFMVAGLSMLAACALLKKAVTNAE